MKKLLGFTIIISLALTFSACAPKETENKPVDTEKAVTSEETKEATPEADSRVLANYKEFQTQDSATITWFEQGWTGLDADKDFVTPEIAALTNMNLGYESMSIPTNDDYKQKLNLMVVSKDVPEIFFGGQDAFTRGIYDQLGANGEIWDLSEIIKEYPNLYELVKPELELYAYEGKYFQIPTQTGRGNDLLHQPAHGIYFNDQFLAQLGMETPSNPEELYTYLKRSMSEIEIDGQKATGLLTGVNLGGLEHVVDMFIPNVGMQGVNYLPFDYKNDYAVQNFKYTDSPELLEAMKYINKLSVEGLFDEEILSMKEAQQQEKATSGLVSVMPLTWWDMNKFMDTMIVDNPEVSYTIPSNFYANDTVKDYRLGRKWTNWIGSYSSLIISKKVPEQTVRHLLAVMDFMATKDGQLLVQAGVEGKSFEWNNENKFIFTQDFLDKTNNMDWNAAAAYGVGYYSQLVFNNPVIADITGIPTGLAREDNLRNWEKQKPIRDLYDAKMEPTPDYYFTPGPIETQKWAPIATAELEFYASIISAKPEEVEGLVKKWADTCKSLGIDEIVAERTATMDKIKLDLSK